jgi:hypothetical protein
MKILKFIIIGVVLFFAGTVEAQLSVRLNIGTPPLWGPVGYESARYYYLPDVESYYDVQTSMFIYNVGGAWVHRSYLPSRFRGYDLYGGYKVVLNDYHGNRPYTHFNENRMRYRRGYHGDSQRTIGERPGRGNANGREYSRERSNERMNHGNHNNMGRGNERNFGHGNERNMGRGNARNVGRGNERNIKKDQGNGHENGKNK